MEANEKFSLTQGLLDEVRSKFGSVVTPSSLDPDAGATAVLASVMRPLAADTPKIPKKVVKRG